VCAPWLPTTEKELTMYDIKEKAAELVAKMNLVEKVSQMIHDSKEAVKS
jgi:hypothetical protein